MYTSRDISGIFTSTRRATTTVYEYEWGEMINFTVYGSSFYVI